MSGLRRVNLCRLTNLTIEFVFDLLDQGNEGTVDLTTVGEKVLFIDSYKGSVVL